SAEKPKRPPKGDAAIGVQTSVSGSKRAPPSKTRYALPSAGSSERGPPHTSPSPPAPAEPAKRAHPRAPVPLGSSLAESSLEPSPKGPPRGAATMGRQLSSAGE